MTLVAAVAAMAVMGGCGTNRAGHGTGHGTIDLSAVAAQKAPTPVKGGTKLASVSGKVGGADRLPGASVTKTIAKGAPSDAEVRRELKKYEKAGLIGPGDLTTGAVGGLVFPLRPFSLVLAASTW
ncbi:MAG: hypothetical protein E6G07_09375, partial [Actinobacteria bacterium]